MVRRYSDSRATQVQKAPYHRDRLESENEPISIAIYLSDDTIGGAICMCLHLTSVEVVFRITLLSSD